MARLRRVTASGSGRGRARFLFLVVVVAAIVVVATLSSIFIGEYLLLFSLGGLGD